MSVYEKLSNIQKELFVPKGNTNDFGKFNYRSCEDILKTVKPLCEKQKCVLFMSNELECIGNRNYVKAIVKLIDIESNEEIVVTAHAREEEVKKGMDGSQITGASSSYARKYALAGLFSIDNEKDSDSTNEEVKEETKKQDKKQDKKQIGKSIDDLTAKVEVMKYLEGKSEQYVSNVCANYKVDKKENLTDEQCKNFIEILQKKAGVKNE